jgi:mannose-6-phosphate isomerase
VNPALRGPWRLAPNRVERFYRGGALLERFRGQPNPGDGVRPEDWVGSTTRAWSPPGSAPRDDGLGIVDVDGEMITLRELLEADPAAIAGAALVERAGVSTGLLVKLLDAAVRLPVHAHPSRSFAAAKLGSFFGKTEAWIVLATRQMPAAEPPVVRVGFSRDVERGELISMIDDQRTEDLLAAMHVRPTAPGDVWFIPAGLPHAIGAGVFMIEIEEPADFSIVAETRGVPIDRQNASLRLGWDVAVDAYDRRGWTDDEIDELRHSPTTLIERDGLRLRRLTGVAADPFFRAQGVSVDGTVRPWSEEAFLVGVVTAGEGTASVGDNGVELRAGETFAVPARSLAELRLDGRGLELVACLPPRAADLGPR